MEYKGGPFSKGWAIHADMICVRLNLISSKQTEVGSLNTL